jgi:hypothetical protein
MKYLPIYFLSFSLLLSACRKPQDSPAPSAIITGKSWKLIFYSYNGTDITNKFSNCIIKFEGNGTLKATNAGQTFSGTWEEVLEPPKLKMDITTNNQYVRLFNKEWEKKLLNPTRVEFVDNRIAPQENIKFDLVP